MKNFSNRVSNAVTGAQATLAWAQNQFTGMQLQRVFSLKQGSLGGNLILGTAAAVVTTTPSCDVGEDITSIGCDHTGTPDVELDDGDAILDFLAPGSIHVPVTFSLTGAECPDEQFQLYGKLIVRDSFGNIFYESEKQQQTVNFEGQPVDTEFQFTGVPSCGGGSYSGELQLEAQGKGNVHIEKSLTFQIN